MRMLIFDGIFDGDDVLCIAPIDFIHKRGECGRLARSGWPSNQDQAIGDPAQTQNTRGKIEFGETWRTCRQSADRGRRPPSFVMQIDAKSTKICKAKRAVRIADFSIL